MDQFPSNSHRPVRGSEEQTKKVERIVTSEVVRRKTPIGRRMTQNLIGGDVQSVWGYIFGEVLIPAARDMISDAVSGGVERMLFGDSAGPRRSRRGGVVGHTNYNGLASRGSRPEPSRQMSRRGRSLHDFDELILGSRAEAMEVLDRLDEFIDKYGVVSVAELYELVGISSNHVDGKWGWDDLKYASVSRAGNGYLLNLPKPEPID